MSPSASKPSDVRLQSIVSPQASRAALALRVALFRRGAGDDRDAFDDHGAHLDIRDATTGQLVACLRCHVHEPAEVTCAYAAQFYDLTPLKLYPRPMIEVGRFCVSPAFVHHPDVVRLAWITVAATVEDSGAGMLFGCTCVDGARFPKWRRDPPETWQVKPRGIAVPLARRRKPGDAGPRRTLLDLYLRMGGWVSEQAVRDPDLGTVHVFTALEVAAIPPQRARSLRRLAASSDSASASAHGRLVDAPVAEL